MEINAVIICEKDSHKNIIIGKKGAMLKKIATSARLEMERLLEEKVYLNIFVKVKNKWRNNERQIYAFGYDKTEI